MILKDSCPMNPFLLTSAGCWVFAPKFPRRDWVYYFFTHEWESTRKPVEDIWKGWEAGMQARGKRWATVQAGRPLLHRPPLTIRGLEFHRECLLLFISSLLSALIAEQIPNLGRPLLSFHSLHCWRPDSKYQLRPNSKYQLPPPGLILDPGLSLPVLL